MFPLLDVTTRVLPLTEDKRGLLPHLTNQNHLPSGPENSLVLSLDLLGERDHLVFGQTSGPASGLVHETKCGAGNLILRIAFYNPRPRLLPSEQDTIFFNYVQETPVTKDTFLVNLQGGCREFWGHPPPFLLCVFSALSVWVVGVSPSNWRACHPEIQVTADSLPSHNQDGTWFLNAALFCNTKTAASISHT